MSTTNGTQERITRETLEAKLRGLQGNIDRDAQPVLVRIAYGVATAAALLVTLAYVFGRRSGRGRRTVVEVRRL